MKDLRLAIALANKISEDFKREAERVQKEAQKANKAAETEARRAADQAKADAERHAKQRIQIQLNSLRLAERQAKEADRERQRIQKESHAKAEASAKTHAATVLRMQRQAGLAEAALVQDKFDRRIAIERVKHAQILAGLKGNHAATEAEVRRHKAAVARVEMDRANLPNTPFQQLLGTVNGMSGNLSGTIGSATAGALRSVGVAAMGMVGGVLAAGVAVQKLGQGFHFAWQQAESQIRADKSLQAVMRSTGSVAGGTFAQLQDMAGAMQNLTGAQDDAVQGAQGILLQFDKIGADVFPRALQVSVDLASFLETDLSDAAKTVGLAMQDAEAAGRALRKANVLLSDSEKEKLKAWTEAGDLAKVQEFVLSRMERNVKGHAQSTVTEMTKLKNIIGDNAEVVGGVFIKSFEMGAGALLKMGSAARATLDPLLALASGRVAEKIAGMAGLPGGAPTSGSDRTLGEQLAKDKAAAEARARNEVSMNTAAMKKILEARKKEEKELREQAKKDAEDMRRFREQQAHDDMVAEAKRKNRELAEAREVERVRRDVAVEFDERKTNQLYAARDRAEDAEAAGDGGYEGDLRQLELKQRRELEMYAGNEAAITQIHKAHKLERQRLDSQYAKTKQQQDQVVVQNYMSALSTIGAAIGSFGGKSKEALLLQQALALTQIGVNTLTAATAAVAPPPLGLGPVAGIPLAASIKFGGVAAAAGVIAQTAAGLKGFATGTDWAPGGYAWVGERGPELVELPRGSKVKTAGESIDMANRGYGGDTIQMGGIHITVQGGADSGTVERIGAITNRELRSFARRMEMVKDRRIRG